MTREEVINKLNSIKQYYNDDYDEAYVGFDAEDNEAIDMAIKALKQTRWIPVSEKLPEDGTWNLFTDGNKISIERYKADAIDHFYPNGRWFSLDEAIAWMPLPEPYRESEEDKGGDENGTNNHSTK